MKIFNPIVEKYAFMPPKNDLDTNILDYFNNKIKIQNVYILNFGLLQSGEYYIPFYHLCYNGNKQKNNIFNEKTIIFSHGNGESIFTILNMCIKMTSYFECDIIVYDYTGYSISCSKNNILNGDDKYYTKSFFNILNQGIEGKYHATNQIKPSIKNTYKNILSVFEHVRSNCVNNNLNNIIIMGHSLGCSPSTYITSRINIKVNKVILICPFSTPSHVKFSFNASTGFNNLKYIKKILSPIIIYHLYYDIVIPYINSLDLFNHIDGNISSQQYKKAKIKHIENFIFDESSRIFKLTKNNININHNLYIDYSEYNNYNHGTILCEDLSLNKIFNILNNRI